MDSKTRITKKQIPFEMNFYVSVTNHYFRKIHPQLKN